IESLPRTRELRAEPAMPPIAELRARLGRELSDEELLLRATMPATQVDAMRAAGPAALHYDPESKPVMELLRRVLKVRGVAGLPVDDEQLITPSSIAADHMQRRGIRRVLVLGSIGVGQALRDAGIETVHTGEAGATDVGGVFVGWHPECGMKDIEAACRAIWG